MNGRRSGSSLGAPTPSMQIHETEIQRKAGLSPIIGIVSRLGGDYAMNDYNKKNDWNNGTEGARDLIVDLVQQLLLQTCSIFDRHRPSKANLF